MAAQEDLFDVFSAASEALDGVDDLGEGLDFDMNQDDIQDDLTADTTHQGCAGDSNSPVAKTYVGEDGKVFVNPAALGPAPKRKPLPRPGVTGTPTERAAQQLLHAALEFHDIHTAISYLPRALGTTPSNIPTVLWELYIWPHTHLPLERMFFATQLLHAAATCLKKSSVGPNCFDSNHPLYGTWSAQAGTENDAPDVLPWQTRAPDGIERVGRGAYLLVVEQVVHGFMKAGKWEAALSWARQMLSLDAGDDCGVRLMMPVGMLKLGMGLQCVRFCMDWLDDSSGAGPIAPIVGRAPWAGNGGGGVVGGVDLGLDMVQGRYRRAAERWPQMAFLVSLGCWWMFYDTGQATSVIINNKRGNGNGTGPGNGNGRGGGGGGGGAIGSGSGLPVCKSAKSWLRLGHKSNRHVLRILLKMITHKSTYLGPTGYLDRHPTSIYSPTTAHNTTLSAQGIPDPASYEEASDFVYSTHGLFMDEAREVQRWLVDTAHTWVVNTCTGCGQREGRVGEHRACLDCRGVWYCGVECQRRCWGAHRGACREVKREKRLRSLGRVVG